MLECKAPWVRPSVAGGTIAGKAEALVRLVLARGVRVEPGAEAELVVWGGASAGRGGYSSSARITVVACGQDPELPGGGGGDGAGGSGVLCMDEEDDGARAGSGDEEPLRARELMDEVDAPGEERGGGAGDDARGGRDAGEGSAVAAALPAKPAPAPSAQSIIRALIADRGAQARAVAAGITDASATSGAIPSSVVVGVRVPARSPPPVPRLDVIAARRAAGAAEASVDMSAQTTPSLGARVRPAVDRSDFSVQAGSPVGGQWPAVAGAGAVTSAAAAADAWAAAIGSSVTPPRNWGAPPSDDAGVPRLDDRAQRARPPLLPPAATAPPPRPPAFGAATTFNSDVLTAHGDTASVDSATGAPLWWRGDDDASDGHGGGRSRDGEAPGWTVHARDRRRGGGGRSFTSGPRSPLREGGAGRAARPPRAPRSRVPAAPVAAGPSRPSARSGRLPRFDARSAQFPDTPVGGVSEVLVKLVNPSEGSVRVAIAEPRPPFGCHYRSLKLRPHSFCMLPVRFSPSRVGAYTDSVRAAATPLGGAPGGTTVFASFEVVVLGCAT